MMKNAMRQKRWHQENEAADFIPYQTQIDDHTIVTKGGDYLQVLKLDGLAHECADLEDLVIAKEQLNSVLRNLAQANNVALYSTIIRRENNTAPAGEFDIEFSRQLNDKYLNHVTRQKMFVNELYLTIVMRPTFMNRRFFQRFESNVVTLRAQQEESLEKIHALSSMMLNSMKQYGARLLGTYTKDGVLHSELLELFSFIVNGNGKWKPRALPRRDLAYELPFNRIFFGANSYETRGVTETSYGALLSIKEYPEETFPGFLNVLLSTNFPIIITQSFNFLKQDTAKSIILRQSRRMKNAGDLAESQIEAMRIGLDDLQSRRFLYGEHHFSINVPASSPEELKRNLAALEGELADTSMVMVREDWAIQAAYYAQLPANFKLRPRPAPLSSKNFLGFCSFHNFPTGRLIGNQWGHAVTLLKTTSGSPYYFNFHLPLDAAEQKRKTELLMAGKTDLLLEEEEKEEEKALGNTIIIGPTGSGKTVLQGFLLAQSDKFGAKQFIFDKDRGLELYVRASGGSYLPLKIGESTGFSPFKRLEPTEKNIHFLENLVIKCCGGVRNTEEETDIKHAVRSVLTLSPEMRKISSCLAYLDSTVKEGVHARLSKWCNNNSLAWVFDNDEDSIDFENVQKYGFDVTEFLEDDEIRTPVIMYLFHLINESLDGSRVQIFMDEFWRLLLDDYFLAFVNMELRTIRKKNGILVMGTQSAAEVHNSPIAAAIREQTSTLIFFPNPRARKEDYEKFDLTEREFELIKFEMRPEQREFLVKQQHTSVVAKLDLEGFNDELAIISGTTDNIRLAETIRNEVGNDPKKWVPIFHERRQSA